LHKRLDNNKILYFITDYRKEDIRTALHKAIPWILTNMNEDGGFAFRRIGLHEITKFGTKERTKRTLSLCPVFAAARATKSTAI